MVTAVRAEEKLGVKQIERWLKSAERRKGQKLADGGGLYLTFLPSRRASRQVRYVYEGKTRTFSVGSSGETSLAEARAVRVLLREQLQQGLDPVTKRRANAERIADSQQTFASAREAEGRMERDSSREEQSGARARRYADAGQAPGQSDIDNHGGGGHRPNSKARRPRYNAEGSAACPFRVSVCTG